MIHRRIVNCGFLMAVMVLTFLSIVVASDTTTTSETIAPIILSGTGQQATQMFFLPAGLSVITIKYSSSEGYFSVWLLDSNGKKVDLLASEARTFSGSKAVGIKTAGYYLLDVKADGSWSVEITQPKPPSGSESETEIVSGMRLNLTPSDEEKSKFRQQATEEILKEQGIEEEFIDIMPEAKPMKTRRLSGGDYATRGLFEIVEMGEQPKLKPNTKYLDEQKYYRIQVLIDKRAEYYALQQKITTGEKTKGGLNS